MRYVDIDLLQFPPGWHERAIQALNDLRTEIAAADAQARAAGENVAVARKKAIMEGLKKPGREAIWRELATYLAALRKDKCWYSESLNPASDKNVDHFRPKSRVHEEPDHEGYWWKAFDWKNYRYASQWCNQRRVDDVNGTGGGKWDHFPLQTDSFRARQETDDIELERPVLLDPIDPDEWKLLAFRPDGHPTPARPEGTLEYERAAASIRVLSPSLQGEVVNDRRHHASLVRRTIEDMETVYPDILG